MLEGVTVQIHVLIVVVGVSEKIILFCEHISRRYVGFGKEKSLRLATNQQMIVVEAQVFAVLVPQVGVRFAIANDFHGFLNPNHAVVGGQNQAAFFLGHLFDEIQQRRVLEPRFGNGSVGRLVGGQLLDHLYIGAGVGQHIHEVIDDHIQGIAH